VSLTWRLLISILAFGFLAVLAIAPGLSIPQAHRQVPAWATEGHSIGFLLFGAEMGTGARTYSPSILPHVVALLVIAFASPIDAAAAAVGFALGRAIAVPWIRRGLVANRKPWSFHVAIPVQLWLGSLLLALALLLVVEG
jgi:hypothetical protein